MRRMLIVALSLAVVAVGGAAADAAVKKGQFAGKTSENDPLGFKVNKKHRVVGFYFEGVTLKCSDGDSIDTPSGSDRIQLPNKLRFKVSKSRRFTIAVHSGSGTQIHAKGRFNKKGRRAKGRLRVSARFDSQSQQQDPNGDVLCQSSKLKWSAQRQ